MLKREQWLDLARKLDWVFSYVSTPQAKDASVRAVQEAVGRLEDISVIPHGASGDAR
jgi:hypothetical protein